MDKELYIVRHGQTDFNLRRIVQGRGVNSSLNETGVAQSRLFYKKFKSVSFSRYYASSLKRTHETIKPFVDRGNEMITHKGLDEIDWGIHEGKPSTIEMRQEYKDLIHSWREGKIENKIQGGESPLEVGARQSQFLSEELIEQSGKILICCHGRAMRILLCNLMGKDLTSMDEYPHTNLSLYKVLWDGRNAEIALFNDISHLNE